MKFNKRINRNKNYSKKSIILFAIMFIGLGFAALSATLGINGLAKIGHISFDVHFNRVDLLESSMEAEKDATINPSDNTQIDFSLILTKPGEYYEFEADIVNRGTLDAYLSGIEVIGFDDEISKYLDIDCRYANGGIISVGDLLPVREFERIKVRVSFLYDITLEDLPEEGTEVSFSLKLTYSQDGGKRDDRLHSIVVAKSEGLDNVASRYVESETGINFLDLTSDANGKGVYLRAGTENDAYPVYYYRGDVNDDNVLFGDFCWKIVRTTEQGGTKLVYNGVTREIYENEKLEEDEYKNVIQDYISKDRNAMEEYYTFNSDTKMWIGKVTSSYSEASIRLSVSSSGQYVLDYRTTSMDLGMTSLEMYTKAYIYVNGVAKINGISGLSSSQLYLGYLNPSDVIEVVYETYGNASPSNTISFSIGKTNGGFVKTCDNLGEDAQLDTKTSFNTDDGTLADVGYMYGTRYEPTARWKDEPFIYGSDVTWNGTTYSLDEPVEEADTIVNIATKHYTCKLSTEGTCDKVYYAVLIDPNNNVYAFELTNGKKIETIIEESTKNENDSVMKTVVDAWFEEKLWLQESKLEDAVWCNDRSVAEGGLRKDGQVAPMVLFGANRFNLPAATISELPEEPPIAEFINIHIKDADVCPNKNDRFTKNDTANGNGKLTYPVGLLTFEEAIITGYIMNMSFSSTMSPIVILVPDISIVMPFSDNGVSEQDNSSPFTEYGVRPSIVIKNEIKVLRGDGTATNPYVVDSHVEK